MDNSLSQSYLSEPEAGSRRQAISLRKEMRLFLSLGLLFALAGMSLAAYATTAGPGVGGDATIYLTSARNFASGQGLGWVEADGSFRLLPYSPPFYPLVLSLLSLFVADLPAAARWLNVILLGATSLLAGWSVYSASRRPWLGGLLSGFVALSPVLIGVHLWAMTEPLFLLLGFSSLYFLWRYLDQHRRSMLIAAAVLAGLAFLTRYIGLAFILTCGLALLALRRNAPPGKGLVARLLHRPFLREALLFGLVSVGPMIAWLVVGFVSTGTVASRSGQPAAAYWQRFLEIGPALQKIYLFWLLPDSVAARLPGIAQALLWLVPLLGLAVLVGLLRRAQAKPAGAVSDQGTVRLALIYGLFILMYLVLLAGVQVFTYPPVTLASRMLSPVHLAVLVLLSLLLYLAQARLLPASHLAMVVFALAVLALLGSYGLRSALIARDYHQTGIGYNAGEWRDSATVAALKEMPAGIPIITNEVTAVMYFTGRPAYVIQEIYQDQPSPEFTVYGSGDDPGQRVFRERDGALVLFYNTLHDDFAMYGDQVEERLAELTRGLHIYNQSEDGAIYFYYWPDLSNPVCDPCQLEREP